MATSGVGYLIYSGIMPLVKTFMALLFGYILARNSLFPPAASRGASQVTMYVSLPALIFANIVPAFTPSNASSIGPLLLSAFVYQTVGFLFGFLIREVCYVPRNFYQGLLVLTGMSNWGNLPTAVVLTVTQEPPFNPSTDPALGVSFVSIFIVAYHVVFWVFGAAHSLSWDYLPGVPQGEEAERRLSWREKPIGGWVSRVILGHRPIPLTHARASANQDNIGKEKAFMQEFQQEPNKDMSDQHTVVEEDLPVSDMQLAGHISRDSVATFRSRQSSVPSLPTFRGLGAVSNAPPSLHLSARSPTSVISPCSESSTVRSLAISTGALPQPSTPGIIPPILARIFHPLSTLVTPITLTLFISIPIALIQPLKALFVDTTDLGGPLWKGPDGRPPLYFVIDTASFLGSITVPMALVVLGASFARLSIPRPISRLAIPAMFAVALAKMFVLPVIGVLMVQAMVNGGLIPRENKAERFVAMFLSGTPAAVNQLIVTQLYAPDGNVDTLSAFLFVQYVLMFFSSAALTAVSLALL